MSTNNYEEAWKKGAYFGVHQECIAWCIDNDGANARLLLFDNFDLTMFLCCDYQYGHVQAI